MRRDVRLTSQRAVIRSIRKYHEGECAWCVLPGVAEAVS